MGQRSVTGIWLPHPQVHQDLVQLLHPQVSLLLGVSTQPISAQETSRVLTVIKPLVRSTCPYGGDLPGDTHGVLALADERFSVIISPWSDGDELQRVGPGTELSAGWFHCLTGAVGQVDATNGILREQPCSVRGLYTHFILKALNFGSVYLMNFSCYCRFRAVTY